MCRTRRCRRSHGVLDGRLLETGVVRMTTNAWIQMAIYLIALVALVKPLGSYMARVYQGQPCGLDRALGWLERGIYRLAAVDPQSGMGWKTYTVAVLLFNGIGLVAVYALQRVQGALPFNPQEFD